MNTPDPVVGLTQGTSVNPETGAEVVRAYAVLKSGAKIKILDSIEDLKKFGKPADVVKALLTKTGEYGAYAHLPKIEFVVLKW